MGGLEFYQDASIQGHELRAQGHTTAEWVTAMLQKHRTEVPRLCDLVASLDGGSLAFMRGVVCVRTDRSRRNASWHCWTWAH